MCTAEPIVDGQVVLGQPPPQLEPEVPRGALDGPGSPFQLAIGSERQLVDRDQRLVKPPGLAPLLVAAGARETQSLEERARGSGVADFELQLLSDLEARIARPSRLEREHVAPRGAHAEKLLPGRQTTRSIVEYDVVLEHVVELGGTGRRQALPQPRLVRHGEFELDFLVAHVLAHRIRSRHVPAPHLRAGTLHPGGGWRGAIVP